MSIPRASLAAEKDFPASPVTFPKPELQGLFTHVKGIALEKEDSPMEEFNAINLVGAGAPPPLAGLSLPPNPLTPMDISGGIGNSVDGWDSEIEECHTPRGEEYRIPEILVCPPAPRRPTRKATAGLGLTGREYFRSEELEELLKQEDGAGL